MANHVSLDQKELARDASLSTPNLFSTWDEYIETPINVVRNLISLRFEVSQGMLQGMYHAYDTNCLDSECANAAFEIALVFALMFRDTRAVWALELYSTV